MRKLLTYLLVLLAAAVAGCASLSSQVTLDPWFDYPFYPRYRFSYRPFLMPPYAYTPFPFPRDDYRWVAGGNVQTLKAVAVRIQPADAGTASKK